MAEIDLVLPHFHVLLLMSDWHSIAYNAVYNAHIFERNIMGEILGNTRGMRIKFREKPVEFVLLALQTKMRKEITLLFQT